MQRVIRRGAKHIYVLNDSYLLGIDDGINNNEMPLFRKVFCRIQLNEIDVFEGFFQLWQ